MNTLLFRRISFTVIMAMALCFFSPVSYPYLGISDMTQLEFILSVDRGFFAQNSFIDKAAAINIGLSNVWFAVLLPFMVSISGLFIFADTLQGFWRMEYVRTTKRRYRVKKFLSVCGFGAGSVAGGYLMYILIACPFFPDVMPAETNVLTNAFTKNPLCVLLSVGDVGWFPLFLYIFLKLFVVFVFSFMTASLCLCFYLAVRSCYKAVGMPLIAYYLLICVSTALFNKSDWDTRLFIISPMNIIRSSDIWFPDAFGISFWWLPLSIITLSFGFYILYVKLLNKRIEQ